MIHIITTGGTIEGLDYETEENETKENRISIEDFFKSANVSFSYSIESGLATKNWTKRKEIMLLDFDYTFLD